MTTHYDYTDRSGRMFRRFTDRNGKPMGTQYLGMAETAHQEISSSAGGSSSIADRLRVIAAEIERLTRERDAFKAQADDVVEIDIDDVERVIKAAKSLGKDSIRLSARDIWRMASDRRGRNEPDEEWDDD